MATGGVFSLENTALAPRTSTGCTKCVSAYTCSSSVRTTTLRFGSSAFMCHGSVSVTYLLTVPKAPIAISIAECSAKEPYARSVASRSASMSRTRSAFAAGTHPAQYFSQSASARLTKLPKVPMSSALCRIASASSENVRSPPSGASRTTKYRNESRSNLASTSSGSTTLPRLFDILRPSAPCTKPCARTVVGSGSSSDMRSAGQITQWNQVMSLPITWTAAGQKARKASPSG
mmetsp:Transcript_15156/g.32229  ORF Transcript_15156/g.32229 Transcript_15156/m.32229 type:complete len:233 (+) Transcript_15156:1828-2526(+)